MTSKKFDKINLSILAIQGVIALFLIIFSLFNIESQQLLLETRYNLLKGFVEKGDWFVFYFPVFAVAMIFVANLVIVKSNHKVVDKILIHSYLFGSLIAQLLAVVVIMSMQSAVGF